MDTDSELVTVYKALADGNRLRIIGLLVERRDTPTNWPPRLA